MGVLFTSFPKEGSEVIPGVESFCQEAFNAKKKVISSVAMKYVYADKEGQDDQTPCDQTTCFKYGLDPQRWVEFAASCKTPTWQLGAGTSLPGLAAEKLGAYQNKPLDWKGSLDPCNDGWDGIEGIKSHATSIFLVDCGFIGPIPYEIGPLKELKHVKKASHNLKYVLTTYEGKHNHEVPIARTNNQKTMKTAKRTIGIVATTVTIENNPTMPRMK
ncbi:hypothetical protein JHK85_043480 [Glycine max]|nr:hypothetical protein JHK85_043480 [Glycine max]